VPYRSLAFPQTHPDHLAAVARIFNLSPPDVGACRVLELGCASGGNLLPMAFNLPGSELVGVDSSRRQVDDANAARDALKLGNLRVECASLEQITPEWGTFDYIICHGVFSWVEPAVQDKILQIAAEQLTPQGIAYISYNTYPGWHLRESVREMMRYHAGQFSGAQEKVDQARALLKFLASATEQSGPYGQLLSAEVARLDRSPDSYLFHEHLERTNAPAYFHQFMERADRAGLQYLAEAAVTEMLTAHFPPHVAETIERISPDILHLEQYMDFVRNRQFRQTLLCRAGQHPRRALTPAILPGLLMSSAVVADATPIDLSPGATVTFADGSKRAQVSSAATKAAFAILAEHWPCAVEFDRLCDQALDRAAAFLDQAAADDTRAAMAADLFGAVMYGVINLHTRQVPCTNTVSERPRACAVAAFQARTSDVVVNAHHAMVQLEPPDLELLTLSDGRRGRDELLAASGAESFEALRRHGLLAG
jgi:methyltransferase-like protein/trans-aconitate methyltransferase